MLADSRKIRLSKLSVLAGEKGEQIMNSTKYKTTIGTTALCLILAFVAFGQTTGEKLSLNQPLERQIKGGETHSFQFNVKAGQYARAEVEQKNIDVVVSLFAPDGKLVVEMDGVYRVEI